jgi:hypothetical protein
VTVCCTAVAVAVPAGSVAVASGVIVATSVADGVGLAVGIAVPPGVTVPTAVGVNGEDVIVAGGVPVKATSVPPRVGWAVGPPGVDPGGVAVVKAGGRTGEPPLPGSPPA